MTQEQMTPEQIRAAEDLALYTVNTRALYEHAQNVMGFLAARQIETGRKCATISTGLGENRVSPQWVGQAKRGRGSYQGEMGHGGHVHLFFETVVLREAARMIADHYAEEFAETLENLKIKES